MLPPEDDLNRRKVVWDAMQVFWLDTEIDELSFNYAARICAETDYSLDELEQIYWLEVYPTMWINLWATAGEWQPISIECLSELILKRHKFGRRIWFKSLRLEAFTNWNKLKPKIEALRSS